MKLLPEVSLCVNVINSVTTNLAYCITLSALSGQVGTCTQCNDIRTPMAMKIRFVTAYEAWCTTHGNSNCCRNSHKSFARTSNKKLKKNCPREQIKNETDLQSYCVDEGYCEQACSATTTILHFPMMIPLLSQRRCVKQRSLRKMWGQLIMKRYKTLVGHDR